MFVGRTKYVCEHEVAGVIAYQLKVHIAIICVNRNESNL